MNIAAFGLVTFAGLALNSKHLLDSNLGLSLGYFLRLVIYPLIYFFISSQISESKKYLNIATTMFLVLGLVQYSFFPDMRYLKLLGFDDHYYRLIGTFYDPNFTGAVLAAMAIYYLIKKKYILSISLIIGLSLTFSRASYLAFVVALFFYIFISKQYKVLLSTLLLAVLILLSPKPFGEGVNLLRTYSIYSRIESWQSGLNLFYQKPLFGWGYNLLRNSDGGRYPVDNSIILLLATTGIIGTISFITLNIKIWRCLSIAGKSFVVSILVHSMFNNTFLFAWIYFLYWVVVSLETKGYKSP